MFFWVQNQHGSNLFHCFAFNFSFVARGRVPLLLTYLFIEGILSAKPSSLRMNILDKRNTAFASFLTFQCVSLKP